MAEKFRLPNVSCTKANWMLEKFKKDREERINTRYKNIPPIIKDASFTANQDNTAPERNQNLASPISTAHKTESSQRILHIIFRKFCKCWCKTKLKDQIIPSEATELRAE